MATIEIANVWKKFHMQTAGPRTLKEAFIRTVFGARGPEGTPDTFWALQDVSFQVEKGETFGIIGSNGSGKSTLLKLITGITKPSRGGVGVNGRVSALLELGAGFHPDFSGRENTFLNGAILGLSRKEVERRFDSIVAFSELERFIDNPVKTYSSGMYMRLAFAIAVHVDPDILVIDEVLAVGDGAFQQKCFDQIQRFKHDGKTILFVSHDLNAVETLCQRAAWVDRGVLRAVGKTREVLDFYSEQINESVDRNKQSFATLLPDARASLRNITASDATGAETGMFMHGQPLNLGFEIQSDLAPGQLDLFVRLFRADRTCCYDQRLPMSAVTDRMGQGRLNLTIPELRLNAGTYVLQLNAVLANEDTSLDEKYFNFTVDSPHRGAGIAPLEGIWSWREARSQLPAPASGQGPA